MLTFLIALFAVNINLTSATPLSMLENDYYYDQLSLSNGNNPTNELLFTGRQHPATTLAPTLYGASSYDAMDASASNDSTLAMVSSFGRTRYYGTTSYLLFLSLLQSLAKTFENEHAVGL